MRARRGCMTTREFLTNVSIILTVMAASALIETLVPMFVARPWRNGRRTANLGLTAVAFTMNWLLSSIAAAAAIGFRPAGLFARLGWPGWVEVAVGIVILDFSAG